MLLINIHHYIMGLAGSARAGGEEPGRRRRHAGGVGGRIPGPGRRRGWGSRFLSGDQKRGGELRGRSQMARRGRVGGTAGRREEVWGRGGVLVNSCPLPPAFSAAAGARAGGDPRAPQRGSVLPPAACPWECGSPTRVTPRPDRGPGWQRSLARRWWRPGAAATWGVDGGRRVVDAKGRGGGGAVRRVGLAWAPGSVGPLCAEREKCLVGSPPRPGRAFDALYSCPRPHG